MPPILPIAIGAVAAAAILLSRRSSAAGPSPLPGPGPSPGPLPGPMPGPNPAPGPVPAIYPIGGAGDSTGENAGRPQPSVYLVTGVEGPGNAPITIAKYGGGDEGLAFTVLADYNPHLNIGHGPHMMGGSVGQAINVPWSWAALLHRAGYKIYQDVGAQPGVKPNGVTSTVAGLFQNGRGYQNGRGQYATGCGAGCDCDPCKGIAPGKAPPQDPCAVPVPLPPGLPWWCYCQPLAKPPPPPNVPPSPPPPTPAPPPAPKPPPVFAPTTETGWSGPVDISGGMLHIVGASEPQMTPMLRESIGILLARGSANDLERMAASLGNRYPLAGAQLRRRAHALRSAA